MATIKRKVKLGQHFLMCDDIVKELVNLSHPHRDDVVVEIGAGKGKITEELLLNYKKVIALEKDRNLVIYLKKKFKEEIKEGRLELLNKDFRDVMLSSNIHTKLVASIPYYISQEVIEFIANSNIEIAVLILQDEFAKKIVSEKGKNYNYISYLIQFSHIPIYIKQIPPHCFSPPPQINSAIVKIIKRKKRISQMDAKQEEIIKKVVKEMFNYKNKKAIKALQYALPETSQIKINKIIGDEKKVKDMDVYELTEFVKKIIF